MSIARNLYVTTPAPDDDSDSVGDDCTPKQVIFARWLAETGNQAVAYRKAYEVNERTLPSTVWANASRIANKPNVKKLADEFRRQASLETIISIREMLQWHVDIATADPNEIGYVAKRACRYCHGIDHKYQWKDDDEYTQACVAALDEETTPPSDEGGYGYTRAVDPVLSCTECLGNGETEVILNDTTKLTGKARKLFKGLDYKNGAWVVLMHDQTKSWEFIGRSLGAFKDSLDLRTPAERGATSKMGDNVNEQDAGRAYLALIG